MTRLVLTLWMVVCATITLHAGHAAHHWVTVATDQQHGLDSSAFWHTYLRFLHWGMLACAASTVSLVSVAGMVLRSEPRAASLLRHRRTSWLVGWTTVLLLGGITAYQWLTQAASLVGTGQITPVFWHAYLQFHLWAMLAFVALLVGLLSVSVAFRRIVTLWPSAGASVAILVGLGSLYWLNHAGQEGVAQAGLADPTVWHPFLRFQHWVLIAYVTALVGVLGASVALRRVITWWPTGGISLAIVFGIAAWNTIYVTRAFGFEGFEAMVVGGSWLWGLYLRFHAWATLSFFALLVSLVGAGITAWYTSSGQQRRWTVQGQPPDERVPLDDAPAQTVPPRPLGVTVLGGMSLLGSIVMLPSLLIQQTPQVILAFPVSLSLGLGFLGQRWWSWEVGMLYFGVIPVVSWSLSQSSVGAPWSQGAPVVHALLLLYLWSVRRVFVA